MSLVFLFQNLGLRILLKLIWIAIPETGKKTGIESCVIVSHNNWVRTVFSNTFN